MTTISGRKSAAPKSMLRSNPILNRLSKVQERAEANTATYAGIASKTTFFLLVTLVGMMAQLLVKAAMANEPVWQSFTVYEKFTVSMSKTEAIVLGVALVVGLIGQLVGVFAQKTVPVTGAVYSASQGYVISFLVFKVLNGYEYLGLEALLLTVAVVAVMSWLYTAGIIQADKKFHTVLLTLMLGSVAFSVIGFLGSLIPATRPYVEAMLQNAALTIALDVIGLIIAALFLISDFSVIDNCVKQGYPKKYEWYAAFGLVFTVLWIYLKILDLLMQLSSKNKD